MSALEPAAESADLAPPGERASGPAARRWEQFEAALSRWSDRLNPILVKEARQALRSRQFTTTFFLMLAAGWTWSMLGLALLGPAAYYNAEGAAMFYVFYLILSAPLVIAIPYYAFSALSAERQDRTYELVSITALGARQVLTGKLAASGLQMLVYLSALFPCLAFTYLLRGLDIFTVFLTVGYACLASLGLSMVGLLLATLTPSRQRQMAQGVLFAVLLVFLYFVNLMVIGQLVSSEGMLLESRDFWELNATLALLYANAFALVFLSARSLLMAPSQNRSTALRVGVAVAQLSFIGWVTWAVLRWEAGILFGLVFLSTLAWFLFGSLMVGESAVLSPRVKRDLPQSWLARVFFTWFAPGPGTGYLFVISNMLLVTLVAPLLASDGFRALAASWGVDLRGARPSVTPYRLFEAAVIGTSYVAIYLGLGKLILAAARRFDEAKISLRILVHLLLVLLGGGLPWVIQITYPPTRNLGYTLMQVTNPVWTLWEACARNGLPATTVALNVVLPAAAALVWLMNLPSLAVELRQVRTSKPPRVAEEDRAIAAARAPEPARTSPWDN